MKLNDALRGIDCHRLAEVFDGMWTGNPSAEFFENEAINASQIPALAILRDRVMHGLATSEIDPEQVGGIMMGMEMIRCTLAAYAASEIGDTAEGVSHG